MTFALPDLGKAVENLEALPVELAGTDRSVPAWEETYVRPADAFGRLLQAVQTDQDWSEPRDGVTQGGCWPAGSSGGRRSAAGRRRTALTPRSARRYR